MERRVAVIGAGPGGYVAALRAAQLGARVTLIEKEYVGGACLNRGCIPSKVMKAGADLLKSIRNAGSYGIEIGGMARLDMSLLMKRKEKIVQAQREALLKLFHHHHILYMQGKATLSDHGRLSVVSGEAVEEVPWDKLILAPGSSPMSIPSLPFDGTKILSSDHVFTMSEVPRSLLIVGAGVIGCEFAFIFSSFGTKVTLVEAMPRPLPLPGIDEDTSKLMAREMKKSGIGFLADSLVEKAEGEGSENVRATIRPFQTGKTPPPPEPKIVETEKIIVCIGRKPNTKDLGLQGLGIKVDSSGWILVDERMGTGNPDVYAIGDVLGPSKIMLAHVASAEGLAAAENALGGEKIMDYEIVPGAIFASPEVATVGVSEAEASAKGQRARSDAFFYRNIGKAQVMGEIAGQAKIVSNPEDGRILGVQIVGSHATDLIAEAALAMRMGGTVADVARTIHAHPTLAEILYETSLKAMGQSLYE